MKREKLGFDCLWAVFGTGLEATAQTQPPAQRESGGAKNIARPKATALVLKESRKVGKPGVTNRSFCAAQPGGQGLPLGVVLRGPVFATRMECEASSFRRERHCKQSAR